ncbi:hypothetical protein [Methylobacterium sp. SI9]|uniref:hypothetical protein n=1 Tax=Methylobacterium guangdongense TaxID=3138811 RepID=UPI00313D212F
MRILTLAAALAAAGPLPAPVLPAPGMYCPSGEDYRPIFVGPGPRDISIDGMECHDVRTVQGKLRATCFTNSLTDTGGTYPLDVEVLPTGELSRYGTLFRRVPRPGMCPAG